MPPISWLQCSGASWQALRAVFGRWAEAQLDLSFVNSLYTVDAEAALRGDHMSGVGEDELRAGMHPAMAAQLEAHKEESRRGFLKVVEEMDDSDLMNSPELANVPGSTPAEKREAMRVFAHSREFFENEKASANGGPLSVSADYAGEFPFWAVSKLLPLPNDWRDAKAWTRRAPPRRACLAPRAPTRSRRGGTACSSWR